MIMHTGRAEQLALPAAPALAYSRPQRCLGMPEMSLRRHRWLENRVFLSKTSFASGAMWRRAMPLRRAASGTGAGLASRGASLAHLRNVRSTWRVVMPLPRHSSPFSMGSSVQLRSKVCDRFLEYPSIWRLTRPLCKSAGSKSGANRGRIAEELDAMGYSPNSAFSVKIEEFSDYKVSACDFVLGLHTVLITRACRHTVASRYQQAMPKN